MKFIISKLPQVNELVIARMDTRNEPFAIGVVVAEPTLRNASCPPQRTHTLTLQRNESIGGAVRAAAAVGAAAVPAAGRLAASQWENWPLSKVSSLSLGSFDVLVQWYDLQSDWVTKLRLLDDDHWNAEYAKHARADELVAAQVRQRPPSADWIVKQYRSALFLPKPGKAEEVQDTLAVASLIVWGGRDALLTAAGQLTAKAFEVVRRDLVDASCEGQPIALATVTDRGSDSSSIHDDDKSSDDEDSSRDVEDSITATQLSRKRQRKQDAAKSKRRRTNAVARAAPLSAPATLAQSRRITGTRAAATPAAAVASAAAERAAVNTAASSAATAAGAAARAAAVAAADAAVATWRCADCGKLNHKMYALAQDVHFLWLQLDEMAARAYPESGYDRRPLA